MYTHFTPLFSLASESPLIPSLSPPMPCYPNTSQYHNLSWEQKELVQNEFYDSLPETPSFYNSESTITNDYCSSGSGCSSYASLSSIASHDLQTQRPSLIHRSVSSHSLSKNWTHPVLSSMASKFFDSKTAPVRRVYSAGDLPMVNMRQQSYRSSESSLTSESNAIIEGMSKACRYNPEEKKERIKRYKSKKNLRNFNKKIKYVCRKTLADSRPRIRGRFARNDEIIENNSQIQWSHINGEEGDEEDDNYWVNFLDVFSSNLIP